MDEMLLLSTGHFDAQQKSKQAKCLGSVHQGIFRVEVMLMNEHMRKTLKSILGVFLCTCTAILLSALLIDGPGTRFAGPVICLQCVILTSLFFGRLAGLIGSVMAGLTFALCLFPPLGSLAIGSQADLVALMLFQCTAAVAVLLSTVNSSRVLKASRAQVPIYPSRQAPPQSLERDCLPKEG